MKNLKNKLSSIFQKLAVEQLSLVALFAIALFTWQGDFWWPRWMLLCYYGAIALGFWVQKRYGWLCGACVAWPLIGSISVFADQTIVVGSSGGQVLAIENVTLKASISFLLTVIPLAVSSKKVRQMLHFGFQVICLVDSVFVIWQRFGHAYKFIGLYWYGGLLGNPSMNGCLIALSYAYLVFSPEDITYHLKPLQFLRRWEWVQIIFDALLVVIPLVAIGMANSSIAYGAMLVCTQSYFLVHNFDKMPKIRMFFLCGFYWVIGLSAGSYLIKFFLDNSGRFVLWQETVKWWWAYADRWIGTGNGTFFIMGGVLQNSYNAHSGDNNPFIWLHNDWLQTLVEQGIIGAALWVSLFCVALYKTFKRRAADEFATVACFGAVCVFNFPVHSALVCVFGALMAVKIFDKKQE